MGGVLEDKQAKSWHVRNWLPSEAKDDATRALHIMYMIQAHEFGCR